MSQSTDRAATILATFNAAHTSLISTLRDLPAPVAELTPAAGAWSAAQVGWHVALVNEWVANVLLGSAAMAQPVPDGFAETFDPKALPHKLTTSTVLEPPVIVGRDSALERLRASGQRVSKAIASLTPQRGAGYCVALPFGTLSLFEFADFATRHVLRHVGQVERSLARA